jgi:hypothetical protein
VNAAAFAVFGMQVFSAESFGAGWPKRAMRAARGVFRDLACFGCEIARKARLAQPDAMVKKAAKVRPIEKN